MLVNKLQVNSKSTHFILFPVKALMEIFTCNILSESVEASIDFLLSYCQIIICRKQRHEGAVVTHDLHCTLFYLISSEAPLYGGEKTEIYQP